MFIVYIIESQTSGRWYYGYTADLADRLDRHNTGRSLATKGRGPWKLIATKEFSDRAQAMAFERTLKKCKRRESALMLIAS